MTDVALKAGTCGDACVPAWNAYRVGKITWIDDDAGHIAAIVPVDVARKVPRNLSLNRAGLLADLIRAVEQSLKVRYFPFGEDSADNPATYVLRAFTHNGGGFISENEDVRDAHVHGSGIFEHWFPVEELLDAMENLTTAKHGFKKPMLSIEQEKS